MLQTRNLQVRVLLPLLCYYATTSSVRRLDCIHLTYSSSSSTAVPVVISTHTRRFRVGSCAQQQEINVLLHAVLVLDGRLTSGVQGKRGTYC